MVLAQSLEHREFPPAIVDSGPTAIARGRYRITAAIAVPVAASR
jgi:hypothetical protein